MKFPGFSPETIYVHVAGEDLNNMRLTNASRETFSAFFCFLESKEEVKRAKYMS